MEPERIELSAKERERLKVLHEVEQGHLKQVEAARRLRLTDRQVRRLQRRLRTQGDGGCGAGWWGTITRKKICARWVAGWCGTGGRWHCIPIKTAYFTLPGRCSGRSSCVANPHAHSSGASWRNWGSSGSRRTRRRPKGASSGCSAPCKTVW